MKLLVDMNLSPDWAPLLVSRGGETRHWSELGPANAPDSELLQWARENARVVLTQDLDFSQLLFATRECGPSVVILRMNDEFDDNARAHVIAALAQEEEALAGGALLTIQAAGSACADCPLFRRLLSDSHSSPAFC